MARSLSLNPFGSVALTTRTAGQIAVLGTGSRAGPVGAVPTQASQVGNVSLVFLPTGAPGGEAIPASNQHVYLDLTAGAMTHLRSNAQGRLVGVPPAQGTVSLDPTRNYQIVVTPSELPALPSASQGAAVRLSGSQLAVAPNIAIKIARTGGAANLRCILKIGSTESNVSTTAAGWIMSNDQSAGEAMIRSNTLLLQTAGATPPAVTLAIAPASPTRGDAATITVTAPIGTAGFKVTRWSYDISHTNPNAATPSTATVTRPAAESASTFDQNWQGEICASGTTRTSFVVGAVVRASGNASVNVSLDAVDPVEVTLAVTVANRTGPAWLSALTEDPVGTFTRPINVFEDVGHHRWTPGSWTTSAPHTPAAGPNRGCQFLTSATAAFTSTPEINANLTNPSSPFSLAQDKAYLTSPLPVRIIPRSLYTIGAGGVITETSPGVIAAHFGLTSGGTVSGHCISQPLLLAGTNRHEFADPPPAAKSHKGNCLKARRALDPVRFAEALVNVPGGSLNFGNLMQARVNLVASVAPTHDVVDEASTQASGSLVFTTGATILDVNDDNSGALIGPVWNPATNSELHN
jgi:hypothetical protein